MRTGASMSVFRFKHFEVEQSNVAMKVGTDGVLLGAWCSLDGAHRVLDLGTGTGVIALMVAERCAAEQIVGVDIDDAAACCASSNFARSPWAARLHARRQAAQTIEGEMFDVIVSNPPYIKTEEIDTLMPEVRNHEPMMALDGLEDGLHFYRLISKQAKDYLPGGGMLFFEIGYDQGEEVQQIMLENGYQEVHLVKDFAGLDRVVYGVKI